MSVVNIAYSNTAQITITLASLANGSTRESTAIDNSSNLYTDAMVGLKIALSNGTVSGDKSAYVYFYGSVDGVNYTDNVTGSDASVSMRTPTNLLGPYSISLPTNGPLTYGDVVIGSISNFFGGNLPKKWGIVVTNTCGVVFATTGLNAYYLGITQTIA